MTLGFLRSKSEEEVGASIAWFRGTNAPYAVLVKTHKAEKIKNEKEQLLHILYPFVAKQSASRAPTLYTWICGGMSLPSEQIFAEAPNLFFKEKQAGQPVLVEGSKMRSLDKCREVRALAHAIFELKREGARRPSRVENKIVGALRQTSEDENGEKDKSPTFTELLATCMDVKNPKKAVLSLRAMSKHEALAQPEGKEKLVHAALTLLACDNPRVQRECAVILANLQWPVSESKWNVIMITAMKALLKEEGEDRLFKVLRHLLNKAILMCPKGAVAAVADVCKQEVIPVHLAEMVEAWAIKYTKQGDAMQWHEILSTLKLPQRPRVEVISDTAASIHFTDENKGQEDPRSIMEWNVNGVRARWKIKETSEKAKRLKDPIAKGDFRGVVREVGSPDCLVLLESKIDLKSLFAMPCFEEWCREEGYHHIYMAWSKDEKKGGNGYAGVVVLSKVRAHNVDIGMRDGGAEREARVITLEFKTYSLVTVYSPCVGYDTVKSQDRANFDVALKKHVRALKTKNVDKQVVLTGDLNVNPRENDWHEQAFAHMWRQKATAKADFHPGCSPEEIRRYHKVVEQFEGVNVWEHLHPFANNGMTWHPPFRQQGWQQMGQRLDHFIVSSSMIDGGSVMQVASISNYQGVGTSDHCPLVLTLQQRDRAKMAEEAAQKSKNENYHLRQVFAVTDCASGRRGRFVSFESPVVRLEVENEKEPVFVDTGSPFSIYNPPKDKGKGHVDRIMQVARPTGSKRNCVFKGVGGTHIIAKENYSLNVRLGGQPDQKCDFVVLSEHEPTLPKFLIGMDLIRGRFGGMAILPNGEENTVIRFGAAPEVAYECENMQAAKYDHTKPTCNLLEGEGENILKNIPLVAQLQGVLHQKGGQTSREAGEGDPHEMQNSWQSPDEAQKIEAEGRETFNDSPMPALEIILKTSPSGSEGEEGLALIDRGSSINLISRTTLRKLIIKQENFTWDDLSAQEVREMPSIHVQGRKEAKAIAYIQLSLLIQQEKGPIEAGKVSFFVVEGLPVDVVIGNMTMKTWQATLEWDSRIFTITPEGKGEKSNVEWADFSS
jgi:exodeoxyribonuclease-3